ncbi:MAG TPA: PAS domain S-box protein [Burkholderiales bacterium]|nr:PAS domain S-box protein [Burkholderiales bacterium]
MELETRRAAHLATGLEAGADPTDAQFRLLVETVSDYAIYLLDTAGHVMSWNTGAQRIKGYSARDIMGRSFAIFYPPEEREAGIPERNLAQAAREGRITTQGWRLRKDGTRFWADVVMTALRNRAGELTGFAKVTRDITERRRAEQALLERRTLLAQTQALAGLGSWEWDPQTGRFSWSDELFRIFGLEPRSIEPSFEAYLQRVHPEDRQMSGSVVARALAEGQGFKHEERLLRADGAERLVRTHGQIVRDDEGRALKLIAACLDITEQRQAESELQSLTRRLVQAEESERRRIAGELHDRVGQTLSALNINLDILLGMLGEKAPADVRIRLRDSLALVDGTLQSIENVMAELRPPLLEEYGVGAALGWHAEEFSRRTGIAIEFEDLARQKNRQLAREAGVALFRISQEALNNIAKHANARHVTLRLEPEGGDMVLTIQDDGTGFDPVEVRARSSRYGMTTMKERVLAAGGSLEVDSAPGKGTTLRARVPF